MALTQTPAPSAPDVLALRDLLLSWGMAPESQMTSNAISCANRQNLDSTYNTHESSPLHHNNTCPIHS